MEPEPAETCKLVAPVRTTRWGCSGWFLLAAVALWPLDSIGYHRAIELRTRNARSSPRFSGECLSATPARPRAIRHPRRAVVTPHPRVAVDWEGPRWSIAPLIRDPDSTTDLQTLLEDPDADIREAAAFALRAMDP